MVRRLMTDEEWGFFEPFVVATGAKRGRPPSDHRRVLDGIFWIARTGAPWRDLHDYFGPWTRVYRQFRRWTLAGVWELILEALAESGAVPDSLPMVSSTNLLRFADDVVFSSPSAATAIVAARSTSGPREWKLEETGEMYVVWKAERLGRGCKRSIQKGR